MRTITSTITTAVALALALVGCTSDDSTTTDNADRAVATCSRLDECNLLDDVSQQECVDIVTTCVERLSEGYQHDWGVLMDDCLELQSCSLFADCVIIPC